MNFYLGIDFGTSGARAIVIDAHGNIQARAEYPFEEAAAEKTTCWQTALFSLIEQIPQELRREIKAIAINGTSSTVLLCDRAGIPIYPPILYNDARGVEVMDRLLALAPPNHTVLSATSSLAKLLWMTKLPVFTQARYFLHQADWLAFLLHGKLGISDYHNALKLGYDVEHLCYPPWLEVGLAQPTIDFDASRVGTAHHFDASSTAHHFDASRVGTAHHFDFPVSQLLPKVLAPGTPVGEVTADIASRFGLPLDCLVCAGTTDSIAAFLASGAHLPGSAVTSLGSTLVLKLLSRIRVSDARYGIYSHRLGDLWLVGGASNTGGAVLRQFFTDAELVSLSSHIDAEKESPLDYYPLLKAGDRFPINDPNLPPRLQERPDSPIEFLHGLLESIARIEARGYQLLQQLGATQLTHVYTAGGGAHNRAWATIRRRHLQVPIVTPLHAAAAYGTALLALRGTDGRNPVF